MFSDPIKNLKQFGLREDMIVADLGAGTGFYSIATAKMVPRGRVYAIEIQKDFLNTIKNKALEFNLPNLELILGDVEKRGGTKIGNNIVDTVIVSNILFQIEDKDRFIDEVKRILKINGRVLFIDWLSKSMAFDTKSGKFFLEEEVLLMFKEKGFIFERKIDAGEYHYGIIFKKK